MLSQSGPGSESAGAGWPARLGSHASCAGTPSAGQPAQDLGQQAGETTLGTPRAPAQGACARAGRAVTGSPGAHEFVAIARRTCSRWRTITSSAPGWARPANEAPAAGRNPRRRAPSGCTAGWAAIPIARRWSMVSSASPPLAQTLASGHRHLRMARNIAGPPGPAALDARR